MKKSFITLVLLFSLCAILTSCATTIGDGATNLPYIGENGNWWVGGTDTGVAAQGPQGLKGEAGIDGVDGKDGINGADGNDGETPYIGENGNWWIGDIDTEISAKGDKGDKGDIGMVGEPGAAGSSGVDGITPILKINPETLMWEVSYDNGETWGSLDVIAQGPKGEDGADGLDGTNGIDGINGANGITPKLQINPETLIWEISYDNGETWESLGVVAQGPKGEDGADGTNGVNGITPKLQINPETLMWEISYDNGTTWESTGVVARDEDGKNFTDCAEHFWTTVTLATKSTIYGNLVDYTYNLSVCELCGYAKLDCAHENITLTHNVRTCSFNATDVYECDNCDWVEMVELSGTDYVTGEVYDRVGYHTAPAFDVDNIDYSVWFITENETDICDCEWDPIYVAYCLACDEENNWVYEEGIAPGHVWGEWTTIESDYDVSICEKKTLQARYCERCDCCYDTQVIETVLGHTPVYDNYYLTRFPTLEESGLVVIPCAEGCDIAQTFEIPSLTQSTEYQIVRGSCSEPYDIYTYVATFDDVEEPILITFTIFSNYMHDDCPPLGDCTKVEGDNGTYWLYECTKCATWIAVAHDAYITGEKPITNAGTVTGTCEHNAPDFDFNNIDLAIWTLTDNTSEVCDCESEPRYTAECTECEAQFVAIGDKIGHIFGEWKYVKNETNIPDCTWVDIEVRECATCEDCIDYRTIGEAPGHAWTAWTVDTAPTQLGEGILVRVCNFCFEEHGDVCGGLETKKIPALNDTDYAYAVVSTAFCETEGVGTYTWYYTPAADEDAEAQTIVFDCVIPAPGHTPVYNYYVITTKPTMDAEGLVTVPCADGCETAVTFVLPSLEMSNLYIVENGNCLKPYDTYYYNFFDGEKGIDFTVTFQIDAENLHDEAPSIDDCVLVQGESGKFWVYNCSKCNQWIIVNRE